MALQRQRWYQSAVDLQAEVAERERDYQRKVQRWIAEIRRVYRQLERAAASEDTSSQMAALHQIYQEQAAAWTAHNSQVAQLRAHHLETLNELSQRVSAHYVELAKSVPSTSTVLGCSKRRRTGRRPQLSSAALLYG